MFYAYLWLRQNGTPYYVGKGSEGRAFYGSRTNGIKPPSKRSNILIIGRLSEQEAFATEMELIRNWGRKDNGTGCLRNFTNGGEGTVGVDHRGPKNPFFGKKHGDGFRAKRVGHPTSEEARRKMSLAKIGTKNALGHKWEQVGTTEQLSEWANKGHHVRWHINREIKSESCKHCTEG